MKKYSHLIDYLQVILEEQTPKEKESDKDNKKKAKSFKQKKKDWLSILGLLVVVTGRFFLLNSLHCQLKFWFLLHHKKFCVMHKFHHTQKELLFLKTNIFYTKNQAYLLKGQHLYFP